MVLQKVWRRLCGFGRVPRSSLTPAPPAVAVCLSRRWLEWCLEEIQCRFCCLATGKSSYPSVVVTCVPYKASSNNPRMHTGICLSVSVSNSTRTLSCSSCSRHWLPWQPHDSAAALCDNQMPAGRPHQSQPLGKHILVSDFIVRP
jgi:hypothetical protein